FASPNTVAIMNSVPPETRGAASGMRATVQNTGMTASTAIFFSIVLVALGASLAPALAAAVVSAGAPQLATAFNGLPPTAALFAAFLGYNPIGSLVPASVMSSLPAQTQSLLTGNNFFPTAIAPAFMSALHDAFYIASALSLVAAISSWFGMGQRKLVQPVAANPVKEAQPQVVVPLVRSAEAASAANEPGQR
ncbi:MAG TPA: hypothetical protein VGS04_04035, partial [Nitrososphaerales archaeon]|nr:hypothetical protein [Nitrososphaerales archaeon]